MKLNKIKIKKHAIDRFNERFHFETKLKDFEKLIYNNYSKIKLAPKQQNVKINVNLGSIPCVIIVYKSLSKWNIITIYVNEKKPKGKKYVKKIKRSKDDKNEKSDFLYGK